MQVDMWSGRLRLRPRARCNKEVTHLGPSLVDDSRLSMLHSGWRCLCCSTFSASRPCGSAIRRSPFFSFQTTVAMSAYAYMERLADVELQLVMHGLDARSLLQFARCSRPLLHAADHPFAWLHASLHILGWQVESASSSSSPPSRLLRHARLSVRFDKSRPTEQGAIAVQAQPFVDALRSLASPLHHLTCTDATKPRISLEQWQQILAAPSARHLRTLRMAGDMCRSSFDDETVRAISRLAHLHTLAVECCAEDSAVWAALPDAPALTSLQIVDRHRSTLEDDFGNSCLHYVRQCSKLTHLNIWSFALALNGGDELRSFFADSPHHMQRLESLQLTMDCDELLPAPCVAAFSSLVHLHSLHLAHCTSVSWLLPHVRAAPVLRRLRLEVSNNQVVDQENQDIPAIAAIAALLTAAPLLHCSLLLHTKIEEEWDGVERAQPSPRLVGIELNPGPCPHGSCPHSHSDRLTCADFAYYYSRYQEQLKHAARVKQNLLQVGARRAAAAAASAAGSAAESSAAAAATTGASTVAAPAAAGPASNTRGIRKRSGPSLLQVGVKKAAAAGAGGAAAANSIKFRKSRCDHRRGRWYDQRRQQWLCKCRGVVHQKTGAKESCEECEWTEPESEAEPESDHDSDYSGTYG